ncbi:MAG: DUF4157 domain-containing protein [Kofleriaceae bacterium]
MDAIQRSFGHHNVSNIEAHSDGAAQASARAMGAEAFATGNHVVFGGAPSLHTAAHEAAHVVQQAAGVQLSGGVGAVGDSYERHADAVADCVVRGESAESLLDQMAGGGGRGAPAVQHRLVAGANTPDQNLRALVSFLNTLCYGAYVFGLEGRALTIRQGDFTKLATLPPALQTKVDRFGNELAHILLSDKVVTIDFLAGSKFIIGNFDGEAIDLGDIQTIIGASRDDGDDAIDAYGTLAHEISEQFYKQTEGRGYESAHNEASELEFSITGWRRISERTLRSTDNNDGTVTALSELVYQRETAPYNLRTFRMHIDHNKISSLETMPEVDLLAMLGSMSPAPSQGPVQPSPARKIKVEKSPDDKPNKSLVDQFLEDLDDEEEIDMFAMDEPVYKPGTGRDPDHDKGGGGSTNVIQQQVVQMAGGEIRGDDEYRTLFCLSQGWPAVGGPSFEVNDDVRASAQAYADAVIDEAYNLAEHQLQHSINAAHYALERLDEMPDRRSDLIHTNLKKVVPNVDNFGPEELRRVVETLERIYTTLKACTFDALNYKPSAHTTVAYANPGVNVVHLLAQFYTHKAPRDRGLTLIHECAHIIDAEINHDNDETWYLNAYTWQNIANVLDQLGKAFLAEVQGGRR